MPIDPTGTAITLVSSIEPATQLLFLKMFLAGSGIVAGLIASLIAATTWRG